LRNTDARGWPYYELWPHDDKILRNDHRMKPIESPDPKITANSMREASKYLEKEREAAKKREKLS
jgi:hypothetical protein